MAQGENGTATMAYSPTNQPVHGRRRRRSRRRAALPARRHGRPAAPPKAKPPGTTFLAECAGSGRALQRYLAMVDVRPSESRRQASAARSRRSPRSPRYQRRHDAGAPLLLALLPRGPRRARRSRCRRRRTARSTPKATLEVKPPARLAVDASASAMRRRIRPAGTTAGGLGGHRHRWRRRERRRGHPRIDRARCSRWTPRGCGAGVAAGARRWSSAGARRQPAPEVVGAGPGRQPRAGEGSKRRRRARYSTPRPIADRCGSCARFRLSSSRTT